MKRFFGTILLLVIITVITSGYFNIEHIAPLNDTIEIAVSITFVVAFIFLTLLSFKLILPKKFW